MAVMRKSEGEAALGRGFTFLGLLYVVMLLSMTAVMASALWSMAQRGEEERELVFAGRQFQSAIERFHSARASGVAPYPRKLEDMLGVTSAPVRLRTLRRIYMDPITRTLDWGLVRLADGGIIGVFSASDRTTLRGEELASGRVNGAPATYREWRFIAPSAAEMTGSVSATSLAASNPTTSQASAPTRRPAVAIDAPMLEPDSTAGLPVVRPPRQEDFRIRSPEACGRISAYDEKTCADIEVRSGVDAALACRDSAILRSSACLLGQDGALPNLVVGP